MKTNFRQGRKNDPNGHNEWILNVLEIKVENFKMMGFMQDEACIFVPFHVDNADSKL